MAPPRPVLLCILDGWGYRPDPKDNAILDARTPNYDRLVATCPQGLIDVATHPDADVVLPAAAGWCESEGTVTSSERRVQRVRAALAPPDGARDDLDILFDLARRLGHDWGRPDSETIWNEVRVR